MNTTLDTLRHVPPSPGAQPNGGRFYRPSPYRDARATAILAIPLLSIARTTAPNAALAANRVT
jgi:hypothetical protein